MHDLKIIHIKKNYKRNYTLKFDKDLNLVITTPGYFNKKDVDEIINKHSKWINTKHNKLRKSKEEMSLYKIKLEDGEQINLLGESYFVKLIQKEKKFTRAYLSDNNLIIEYKDTIDRKNVKKLFINLAYSYISQKVYELEKIYSVKANSIRIKEQKSKWGSCSTKKNLNFNWKIIFAPLYVIDYLVIHEVCHLKEMNHSSNYWNLVKNTSEQYKMARRWLKDNQERLRYIF